MASKKLVPVAVVVGIAVTVAVILGMLGLRHTRRDPTSASSAVSATSQAPVAAASGDGDAATTDGGVAYDPTVLLDNGVAAGEVFVKEPRSDVWADQVEQVIGELMRNDLETMVPGGHMVMRCKTLSCVVGIDAPSDKRDAALAVTKFISLAPWVVDIEPEEDGTQRWMFFSERRMADAQTFTDWYRRNRKRTLAAIKAGKQPNPFPVALDKLPED